MRCQRATELMSLQLDDMLDHAERIELDAHLSSCALCQETWAAMRKVSMLFAAAPMVAPAPGFARRVSRRIARRQSRRQVVAGYMVLAVGLLLLMALPLTYLAGPLSTVGRAVAQQPEMVSSSLGLLARLGNIVGSFLEACWLLTRAVLGAMPLTFMVPCALLAAALVVFWTRLISGRGMPYRTAVES